MKRLALIFFAASFFLAVPQKVFATQAQLACSPTTSTVAVGSTITADIILNTRSYQTQGADAILTYTSGVIDTTTDSVVPVTSSTNWTDPIKKVVDTSLGQIEIDYGASQSAFASSGTIAKITFTATQEGTANLNFKYFSEYDSSSGVAKVWGQRTPPTVSNILTDVVNCAYTVTGASSTPQVTASPSALPRTGTFETTILLASGGLMLAIFGMLFPRIIRSIQ